VFVANASLPSLRQKRAQVIYNHEEFHRKTSALLGLGYRCRQPNVYRQLLAVYPWLGDAAAFREVLLIRPTFIFRRAGNWPKNPLGSVPVVGGLVGAEYSRCAFAVVNGMGTRRSHPS